MVDPMKEKLARAHSKLRVFEACGADANRSERQRAQAHRLAHTARALIRRREDEEAYEQEQRRKLLVGDRSSRCMFLEG